jgi:hypothetical protein
MNRNLISRALGVQIPNPGSASRHAGHDTFVVSLGVGAVTASFCNGVIAQCSMNSWGVRRREGEWGGLREVDREGGDSYSSDSEQTSSTCRADFEQISNTFRAFRTDFEHFEQVSINFRAVRTNFEHFDQISSNVRACRANFEQFMSISSKFRAMLKHFEQISSNFRACRANFEQWPSN